MEKAMKAKSALLDVEGCVLPNKGEAAVNLLHLDDLQKVCLQMAQKGFFVGLCTGRSQPFAEAVAKTIPATEIPSIIESGCFLYDPILGDIFPHPKLGDAGRFLEIKRACLDNLVARGIARIEPGKEVCISLNPASRIWGVAELFDLEKLVQNTLPESFRRDISVTHSQSAVDITPCGIDKGTGLEFFVQHTGIPIEQIVIVGDSSGDIPGLLLAGHPACPSNAMQSVKELVQNRGGYVASASHALGVVEILKYYFEI